MARPPEPTPGYGRFVVEYPDGRQVVLGSLGRNGPFVLQPPEMRRKDPQSMRAPRRVVAVAGEVV